MKMGLGDGRFKLRDHVDAINRDFWPTPVASEGVKGSANGSKDFLSARVVWPTPKSSLRGDCPSERNRNSPDLPSAVKIRPTPSTTDYRTGYRTDSEAAPGGKLNPDWVEWLMGWPIGWTSTEPLPKTAVTEWLERIQSGEWWATDPADVGDVPRTRTNIPERVARLFATGNGQVPLAAAMAWRLLMEAF